ncbi:toxin-antitoxin system TumE family protein [Virgibacillus sp. FSP13]
MSTGLPKTNFRFLEKSYSHLIEEIRDRSNGFPSKPGSIRKTIIFNDLSKMHCHEVVKNNRIEFYHYDLYDSNGRIIIKFHSEPHNDSDYQTTTEPFHIHAKEHMDDLKASKRLPFLIAGEEGPKDLATILRFIEYSRFMQYYYE